MFNPHAVCGMWCLNSLFHSCTNFSSGSSSVSVESEQVRWTAKIGSGFFCIFSEFGIVRYSSVIVRFSSILVRFSSVIVRFSSVIVRFSSVIVRFSSVLVRFSSFWVRFDSVRSSQQFEIFTVASMWISTYPNVDSQHRFSKKRNKGLFEKKELRAGRLSKLKIKYIR